MCTKYGAHIALLCTFLILKDDVIHTHVIVSDFLETVRFRTAVVAYHCIYCKGKPYANAKFCALWIGLPK